MNEEEIEAIRKLSGRFNGSVQGELDAYHAAGNNWGLKTMAVWGLLAIALNDLEAEQRGRAKMLAYLETFHSNDKELIENVREMLSSADEGQGQQQE